MDNEAEYLQRIVARMRPYLAATTLRRSRLDRVLESIGSGAVALRSSVIAELESAGIRVVDDRLGHRPTDAQEPSLDPEAPRTPTGFRSPSTERSGALGDADVARAVRAARARIIADGRIRRPDRVLLTAEEEIGLAELVRGGQPRPLPRGTFAALKGEPRAAAECLVLHNQRLVHAVARQFRPPGLTRDDLFQHGVIGLIRAVEVFDPTLKFKFSTYATHWIRQAISRAIANESRFIRLPVHMFDRVNRVWAERDRLTIDGRAPSVHRLAHACELTADQVLECLSLGDQRVTSLDVPIGRGEATLGDVLQIAVPGPTLEEEFVERLRDEAIAEALDGLTQTQQDILVRRFGLGASPEQTLQQIGDAYGLTRERIRQIEAKSIKKLQHERHAPTLLPYW